VTHAFYSFYEQRTWRDLYEDCFRVFATVLQRIDALRATWRHGTVGAHSVQQRRTQIYERSYRYASLENGRGHFMEVYETPGNISFTVGLLVMLLRIRNTVYRGTIYRQQRSVQ